MKNHTYFLLCLFSFLSLTGLRSKDRVDDKLGFTITVNGDQFNNQTFFIPVPAGAFGNHYFDFKEDPRAKRTALLGYRTDNSLQIIIDVPIHKTPGNYIFLEDNIPVYMGFQFTYEKDGSSATYMPGKMTVNITRYGKVGEFIEGNFSGELQPRIGGNKPITASGTFKVKRTRDRV